MVATTPTTTPAPAVANTQNRPSEQFDINRATIRGYVQKIWSRGGHTFLRIALTEPADENGQSRVHYITGRIPDGAVNGELVTIMPGDLAELSGFLADAPYDESIREFLVDAKKSTLVDSFPNKEEWDQVRIKRVNTRFEILGYKLVSQNEPTYCNVVELEGVVASVRKHEGDLYVRMAIYDQWTPIVDEEKGKNGRPRRRPHYVTVVFPGSQVSGRTIDLHEKNRLRIVGTVTMRLYSEALKEVLLRTGKVGLLTADGLQEPDKIAQIKATRSTTYVVAERAQIFATFSPKRGKKADE